MDQSSLAFQWLTDNGYPTSGMSQKEGFTTFQLAPILEAYWKFRERRVAPKPNWLHDIDEKAGIE